MIFANNQLLQIQSGMEATLAHFYADHVLFSTYYMLLNTLHADPINTDICYSTMNAHICSAVLYRLEHSTFCVSNTVLSPQAFLVSLMKTDYSDGAHMRSRSLTK